MRAWALRWRKLWNRKLERLEAMKRMKNEKAVCPDIPLIGRGMEVSK